MSEPNIVHAAAYKGLNMSIAQLWGSGPKFSVKCGYCGSIFKGRIIMVNRPRLKCSLCGAINILDLKVTP